MSGSPPDWAMGKAAALLRSLDGSDQDVVRVALAMEDVSLGTRGRCVAEIRRAVMAATAPSEDPADYTMQSYEGRR